MDPTARTDTRPDAPFSGVYAGRRVFVTGHTGFKGSWLSLWLLRLGANVAGYALDPPTSPSLFLVLGLDKGLGDVRGDVRDQDALARALVAHEPEIVFHLAAQALVRPSYDDPVATYATNVMGVVHLLEAVRLCPSVRAVVVVTSDKCYENREWEFAYRENDPMGGHDPYSSSKGCAELVAAAYRASYFGKASGVSLATARAGNVVGGGDWGADRLLPDCVRALSAGRPVIVRNPHAVRPWQYVLEPLAGYLWLAARLHECDSDVEGAWNFGPSAAGNACVRDIVDAFVRAWGSGAWEAPAGDTVGRHEANLLRLDSTRAADLLGWRTVAGFDTAIATTADWYRRFYDESDDMAAVSQTRIDDYVATASAAGQRWAGSSLDGRTR